MSILTTLKEKIKDYADVYIKLLKLNFIEHTSKIMSYLMFGMICLFIVFGIVLFIGFGLSEAFVAMGLSRVASFFITVGIYILLLVLVMALRKNITGFFASGVITALTEGDDDDDDKKKDE